LKREKFLAPSAFERGYGLEHCYTIYQQQQKQQQQQQQQQQQLLLVLVFNQLNAQIFVL